MLYITKHGVAEKEETSKNIIFRFLDGVWTVPKNNEPSSMPTVCLRQTKMFAESDFKELLKRKAGELC